MGIGCEGVRRSITYDRNSSNWSLRCGRRVAKRVDVVRSEEDNKAGESDRVSYIVSIHHRDDFDSTDLEKVSTPFVS